MASVEQPTSDTGGESAGPDPAHGVLASLDKLVELEQRIAGLEAGGGSGGGGGASQRGGTPGSRMSARSRGSTASRGAATGGTQLVFKKKRHATRLDAPAKTTYAVHMVGAGQRGSGRSSRGGTRRTAGQDALLRRSQARRNRQARESQRGQRQDALINNWLSERKTKQAQRRARNASGAGARRAAAARTRYRTARAQRDSAQTGGGARVRRAGTHHQQQFHDVRRQFEDTRSRANRIISNTGPSRYGNSRRGAGASSRRRAAPKYGVERSGATGGSFRFSTRGSAGAGAGSGSGAGARPQLGSRLGGSSASTRSRTTRATRTRTTRTRTTRTRTTRTTRMARTVTQAASRFTLQQRPVGSLCVYSHVCSYGCCHSRRLVQAATHAPIAPLLHSELLLGLQRGAKQPTPRQQARVAQLLDVERQLGATRGGAPRALAAPLASAHAPHAAQQQQHRNSRPLVWQAIAWASRLVPAARVATRGRVAHVARVPLAPRRGMHKSSAMAAAMLLAKAQHSQSFANDPLAIDDDAHDDSNIFTIVPMCCRSAKAGRWRKLRAPARVTNLSRAHRSKPHG